MEDGLNRTSAQIEAKGDLTFDLSRETSRLIKFAMEKAKTSEQADANASACMEASKDMDIPQQHADEWAEYARIWTSAAEALANQMQDLEDGIK